MGGTQRGNLDDVRVLILASELPPGPGGIGTHAYEVARNLRAHGHEVLLGGCQHYVSADERAQFNSTAPVTITTLADAEGPTRTAIARAAQMRRLIGIHRPEVIVASGGRILWLAAAVLRRTGPPLVAVVHGSELGGRRAGRLATTTALDQAAAVVAVSRFTRGLIWRAGSTGLPVSVIPNGANETRFVPDPAAGERFRRRYGLGRRPVILTVGNVTERKGQHRVVAALPSLRTRVPDVRYVVLGRPTEVAILRELARRLGVEDHVIITGQLPAEEVVEAYNGANVFAMTSTSTAAGDVEGYGIAVIEAALCGVPAVVSRDTGAEEAVIDGETGVIADSASPTALAAALASLLTDADRNASMGNAARDRALDEGTWAKRAEAYEQLLDRVVSARDLNRRLVVISHTPHHEAADGSIGGFGPTVRELDHLATLWTELEHVAPLRHEDAPATTRAYTAPNIRYRAVPDAGGSTWPARFRALGTVPVWLWRINRSLARADAVHVRLPAGIGSAALILLALRVRPGRRWFKYAGNWQPTGPDALTYRLQRWWLRHNLSRGEVTVNGDWPDQPPWVHPFFNPTLTAEEQARGAAAARDKQPSPPFHAAFVGRVEREKGAHLAIEVVLALRAEGVDITLHVVGDGPLRHELEDALPEDARAAITFHGWLPRAEVEAILSGAHVFLLPTVASEGFPKAVAEAMAFGAVPVTSGTSSMGQVLAATGGAIVVPEVTVAGVYDGIRTILDDPDGWLQLRDTGLEAVEVFTYRYYLSKVCELLHLEPTDPKPHSAAIHPPNTSTCRP